jgi:hypothetical protein
LAQCSQPPQDFLGSVGVDTGSFLKGSTQPPFTNVIVLTLPIPRETLLFPLTHYRTNAGLPKIKYGIPDKQRAESREQRTAPQTHKPGPPLLKTTEFGEYSNKLGDYSSNGGSPFLSRAPSTQESHYMAKYGGKYGAQTQRAVSSLLSDLCALLSALCSFRSALWSPALCSLLSKPIFLLCVRSRSRLTPTPALRQHVRVTTPSALPLALPALPTSSSPHLPTVESTKLPRSPCKTILWEGGEGKRGKGV